MLASEKSNVSGLCVALGTLGVEDSWLFIVNCLFLSMEDPSRDVSIYVSVFSKPRCCLKGGVSNELIGMLLSNVVLSSILSSVADVIVIDTSLLPKLSRFGCVLRFVGISKEEISDAFWMFVTTSEVALSLVSRCFTWMSLALSMNVFKTLSASDVRCISTEGTEICWILFDRSF